jgi:hypothetical protein
MAKLQLPRNPFAKNNLENRPFLFGLAGRRMHPSGASRSARRERAGRAPTVHVAGILDLPIVQQPQGDDGYVSPLDGQLTEFRLPLKYGNVGLLAHNSLSGRFFSRLAVGQEVHLLHGSGGIETFVITGTRRYQALEPENPYSPVRDLGTGETLTAAQLFEKIYMGSRHLIFQTCIAAQGLSAWGRLFVIAARKNPSGPRRWN